MIRTMLLSRRMRHLPLYLMACTSLCDMRVQCAERAETDKARVGTAAKSLAEKTNLVQSALDEKTRRELKIKNEDFSAALKTQNFENVHKIGMDYADALAAANKRSDCTSVLEKTAASLRIKSADNADIADIYQRQMVNYYELGKISLADSCRDKAIAINVRVRPISDPTAWTYFLAADQQSRSKNYLTAMQLFEKARVSFAQLQPNPLATRDCYFVDVKEAQIEISRGHVKQAIKLLSSALPHLEKYPEPFFSPTMYLELASSYQKVGDENRRRECLKRAYETAKRSQRSDS